MAQVEKYLMLDTLDNKKLAGEISQKYPTKIELPNYTKETYYDTFDWRLFNNRLSLFVSANEYSLRSLQDDVLAFIILVQDMNEAVRQANFGHINLFDLGPS